jgi:hypothetical protein
MAFCSYNYFCKYSNTEIFNLHSNRKWSLRERMKRWLVAVLICIVIVSAFVAYLITLPPPSKVVAPKIGIFYYLWYGAPDSDNWNASKFIDYPVLGNYSSSNATVIKQQLIWMKDAGIDFVVISWWGFYSPYEQFIDNATKQVFEVAEDNMTNLKFAIMVEPFNKTGNSYDYSGIYDHIYDEFVVPYSSIYYNYTTMPLICFFNDENLTDNGSIPLDRRFNTVLVGQSPYVQWVYTDLDYYVQPSRVPYTNEISVTPRFDDSRYRTPSCVVDPNLTQGTYDKEWENAIKLWKDGRIDTIMITSWNEYVERTEIEPHYDGTANNTDPYFLYDKTKDYINQIQQFAEQEHL